METKKAIAGYQESIEFDQRQIEFFKKEIVFAEHKIKIWRIFKMIDKLFLWFEMVDTRPTLYNLYCKQYNKLKAIQEQLEKQYEQ